MKKNILGICCLLLLLCLGGCNQSKEPLPSVEVTEGPFIFEIPENFLKDEEKSTETVSRYISDVYEEASYVSYEKSQVTEKIRQLTPENIESETNSWLKDTYLTNAKSSVENFIREEKEGAQVLRYTLSYNLYSAIVTHAHIYLEKEGELHHLEYYDVEEEGYQTSFLGYAKSAMIE